MNGSIKLGTLAVVASLSLTGCSSSEAGRGVTARTEGRPGTIGLGLIPVDGVTLTSVHYVVTKTGLPSPVLEGDLPTPGDASVFRFALPIPSGTGYLLSVSGVAVESASTTCVGSFGRFDVAPSASANIELSLSCIDASAGALKPGVAVKNDSCPRLIVDAIAVTPDTAQISGTIAVAGAAHDLDGKPVSYAWKVSDSSVGTFSPANSNVAAFTCLSPGTHVGVTLTANNGECSTSLSTSVSCGDAPSCGNRVLDPGEACDPSIPAGQPGFGPCLPNCRLAVCGNGIVEAPFETCDPFPPDPARCSATCRNVPECGDGILSPTEPCDGTLFQPGTPVGFVCTSVCSLLASGGPDCNNGVLERGELCDPPFSSNDCGANCAHITSAACLACENNPQTCADLISCDALVGLAAVGPAAGTPKSNLCNGVLDCVRDSGCATNAPPILCYCGGASEADCLAGLGTGACRAQLERGLETTSPATIAVRLSETTFGGGLAISRINCDSTFCQAQCF